jgi:hypothetical protein
MEHVDNYITRSGGMVKGVNVVLSLNRIKTSNSSCRVLSGQPRGRVKKKCIRYQLPYLKITNL